MKLILATGREIEASRVIKGGLMDYLHIYVNSLTPAEIYSIFNDNPKETEIMTAIEIRGKEEITHVFREYTELYCVQKPFLSSPKGTWMVWMQRPTEVISDGT